LNGLYKQPAIAVYCTTGAMNYKEWLTVGHVKLVFLIFALVILAFKQGGIHLRCAPSKSKCGDVIVLMVPTRKEYCT
jgi:hypothetical protein